METKIVKKMHGWYSYICLWIYWLYHLCWSCRCTVYMVIRAATAPQMVWYRTHLEQEEHHDQTHLTDLATLSPGCCEDGFKLCKMSCAIKVRGKKWPDLWPVLWHILGLSLHLTCFMTPKPISNSSAYTYQLWANAVVVRSGFKCMSEEKRGT